MTTPQPRLKTVRRRARSGFSLIEIMVVIAIASIVVGISVRGFGTVSAGNSRTQCQTNLTQIYNALRLYMSDESGQVPPFDIDATDQHKHVGGIGLWALYTYSQPPNSANLTDPTPGSLLAAVDSRPVSRYLRNVSALHCPSDTGASAADTTGLTHDSLYTDNTKTAYNPSYLSYGALEDLNNASTEEADTSATDNQWPYRPNRPTTGTYAVGTQRQLAPTGVNTRIVPPNDDTVVTWCPYHRKDRDYDEVLFFDGTVRYLPHMQEATTSTGTTAATGTGGDCTTVNATCFQGAQRVPRVAQ